MDRLAPEAPFECARCGLRFRGRPAPVYGLAGAFMGNAWHTECPGCGSLYVTQLTPNYPEKN